MLEEVPSEVVQGGLGGVVWLLGLLVSLLLLALGLWALRRWKWRHDQGTALQPDETALLVKIAYQNEREPIRQGYLRSLTADRATLVVADRALRKGSQVRLDLGSLHPQAHQGSDVVLGRVTQTKRLSGSNENLLVNVQFLDHNFSMQDLGRPP
jgi:hypothetical protein